MVFILMRSSLEELDVWDM